VVFSLPGSEEICKQVMSYLPWQQGKCSFRVFGNSEISVKVEQGVANQDVFVICCRDAVESEVNFALMRLLLFVSALRGESPYRITVVLPCLDYSRQDRRLVAGESIAPKLLLRCLKTAGADRFLTVDLHNEAEAAFAPVNTVLDELPAYRYLADFIRQNVPGFNPATMLVCATNGGGMTLTRRMAAELRTGLMMADYMRLKGGGHGEVKVISSTSAAQVEAVIIVDDMFDTCGSLVAVCRAVNAFVPGTRIYAIATHGYFSGKAHSHVKDLVESLGVKWIAVTNSIRQSGSHERFRTVGVEANVKVVDISKLLAGAIMRIHLGASVNVPKFRDLGPNDRDEVLEECLLEASNSPKLCSTPAARGAAEMLTPPPLTL